jgi:glycosyltransferase involved in cell wall biosynthesis
VTTTPSLFLKEKILAAHPQLPSDHVVVVPHGISPRLYPKTTKRPIILFAGRLIRHKHVHDLIDALANTPNSWELHIAGDGPERSNLERQAAKNGVPTVFHGWLEKSGEAYQRLLAEASIFVLPSQAESFGLAIAEAMSARCAIITTQNSGSAELAGDAALLIPHEDVPALHTALTRLMNDETLRTDLQTRAAKRIEAFDWDVIIPLYHKLLSHPASTPSS